MAYSRLDCLPLAIIAIVAVFAKSGAQESTTIADQYDSIIAYDAPDGQVLYYYETRRSDACTPVPDWGGGGRPFGVGFHYFYDSPVTWLRQVAGSYECADECYRTDCKEFKVVQPFWSGRGRRLPITCFLLWKGCFAGTLEASIVTESPNGTTEESGETMTLGEQRVYKPNALYTYFTQETSSYCGGPYSGDLFSGGIAAYSAEACASLCLFYATKICAAFGFDDQANRCYLKTVNCSQASLSSVGMSKIEAEQMARSAKDDSRKLDFYVRKPWLSSQYDSHDLIRFDQTECTTSLPGPTVNFSSPDEPAQLCKKNAECAGFQCFQYCKQENMPTPWQCNEWDPDVQQYECSFVLTTTPCRSGHNNVPARRSFLFIKHDFTYSRPFIAPEFYSRLRRSTTPKPARRKLLRSPMDVGNKLLRREQKLLRRLRRVRKAQRVRRLHRLAMGDDSGDRAFRKRMRKLRKTIRAKLTRLRERMVRARNSA